MAPKSVRPHLSAVISSCRTCWAGLNDPLCGLVHAFRLLPFRAWPHFEHGPIAVRHARDLLTLLTDAHTRIHLVDYLDTFRNEFPALAAHIPKVHFREHRVNICMTYGGLGPQRAATGRESVASE